MPIDKQTGKTRHYVASLTGLRGVAALFVFFFHYGFLNPGIRLDLSVPVIGKALQFPLGLGFAGVDLFFVLSGFLLTLPFAHAGLTGTTQQNLFNYYKRRLLRVFPAYYAQLAIILLVGTWFVTWNPVSGMSLLAHMVMFFHMGSHSVSPLVGVWWTLPVELSFYLVLPLIALFMRPTRWLFFLLVCILLSIVFRTWAVDHFVADRPVFVFLVASHLPGSLPEFILGASAAMLVQWFDIKSIKPPSVWVLDALFVTGAALAVIWLWQFVLPNGAIYWTGHWTMIVAPAALGLPLSLMVISLYWGSRIGRILFANPVVYFLGLISYSLYLWHFVVLQQIELMFGDSLAAWHGLYRLLFSLSMVVLVSTVSYFVFERPFFRINIGNSPAK
ncbi:MAG: acyltransferase [Gammaproteobacteria bacterium]|nr:acyltransferase [Gammaproteobacteria bacterium]